MNAHSLISSACVLALAALPIIAQTNEKQEKIAQEKMVQDKLFMEHVTVPDVLSFVGTPIHIEAGAPVKGAPYSADAVSETVQALANGNKITRKNTSQIYRDSEGRTRREETMSGVGPWASSGGTKQFISITDPTTNSVWNLDPDTKVAHKMNVRVSVSADKMKIHQEVRVMTGGVAGGNVAFATAAGVAGPMANGEYFPSNAKDAKTEDLGQKIVEGVMSRGTRTTITIPAGAIGNDQPIETVSERWYSDELKTMIYTKTSDPRFGDSTYRLSNVRRAEQPAYLFQVPADYKVEDLPGSGDMPQIIKFDRKQ
jgi:hypothetical protein